MTLRRVLILLLLGFAVLFLMPTAAGFYTDWLWFKELGYETVFLRTWDAQAGVFVGTFVVAALFLALNFGIAERALVRPLTLGATADGRPVTIERRRLSMLAKIVALLVALALAGAGGAQWLTWLNFLHGVPFGTTDPLFHLDVSFYVFRLPLFDLVRQ